MKYFIKTFGCAMNHSDSERIESFLHSHNFFPTNEAATADIAIFNTCGIRQAAENRAYGLINNLKKANKNVVIIMTGCLAHREDVHKRMKNVVTLFCEIKDFPEKVSSILHDVSHTPNTLPDKELIDYLSINPQHTSSFTAYVPIMTGCNNFCTYCVVPYARGREQSRSAEEIIAEIKELVKKNYKHIILLGQNVNSYHGTWSAKHGTRRDIDFPTLLKKINAIPGKFWISFVSSHPKDMNDELIEIITKTKKILENIHLPVQAGNDEILRRMNRKYTSAHYLKLIKKIKTAFKQHKPEIPFSITSDIIVGFPGEKRKQFLESAALMEKAKFDLVFFGQFSPRPGTVAWNMKDNVSKKEKELREKFLNEILKKTTSENNKKYVGKKVEVLIEKKKDGYYFGKTRTLKNVKIISPKQLSIGSFQKVTISKANTWNFEASI